MTLKVEQIHLILIKWFVEETKRKNELKQKLLW